MTRTVGISVESPRPVGRAGRSRRHSCHRRARRHRVAVPADNRHTRAKHVARPRPPDCRNQPVLPVADVVDQQAQRPLLAMTMPVSPSLSMSPKARLSDLGQLEHGAGRRRPSSGGRCRVVKQPFPLVGGNGSRACASAEWSDGAIAVSRSASRRCVVEPRRPEARTRGSRPQDPIGSSDRRTIDPSLTNRLWPSPVCRSRTVLVAVVVEVAGVHAMLASALPSCVSAAPASSAVFLNVPSCWLIHSWSAGCRWRRRGRSAVAVEVRRGDAGAGPNSLAIGSPRSCR